MRGKLILPATFFAWRDCPFNSGVLRVVLLPWIGNCAAVLELGHAWFVLLVPV